MLKNAGMIASKVMDIQLANEACNNNNMRKQIKDVGNSTG